MQKILIIGGSGMLGKPVTTRLAHDGYDVTVMSTRPELAARALGAQVRVVAGDVHDPESLRRTIKGHDAVYINLNAEDDPRKYQEVEIEGAAHVAAVARELDVKRLMMISSASVGEDQPESAYRTAKRHMEHSLIESGVPWTIMRPSWFFSSLTRMVEQGKGRIIGHQPLKFAWLAADDYARQVSVAFRLEGAANRIFYNLGPERMTLLEALRRYCALKAPKIKPKEIPFWQVKLLALLPGMRPLRLIIPFFEFYAHAHENVDSSEADDFLGANTTTLEQWARPQ